MTNAEYEKLCVDSARKTTKEVAAEAVKNLDEKIKDAEKALQHLQEARRELVNRYDLNKCDHTFEIKYYPHNMDSYLFCSKCREVQQ